MQNFEQPCSSLESNLTGFDGFSDSLSPKQDVEMSVNNDDQSDQLVSEFYIMEIYDVDPLETKINAWLDSRGVKQMDPKTKEYQYYQERKSMVFKEFNIALSHSEGCIQHEDNNNLDNESVNQNIEQNRDRKNSLAESLKINCQSPTEGPLGRSFSKKLSCDLSGSGLLKRRQRKYTAVSQREIV